MTLAVKDRVRETSATAGTGTLTLAGAVSGFQAFSVIGNANTTYYGIVDATTGDWEVGIGTYTLSGTTLSRTTVLSSSNASSLVNFAANSKDVFVTYPSSKSVYYDASSNLPVTGALNVTSASATSLAVGLTGATNPAFTVDSSTASQVAGLKVTGAATGGTVAVVATDSGSNTNLTVNAKGTGTIGIGSVSTGLVTITPNTSFTGAVGIGATSLTAYNLRVSKALTGATTTFSIANDTTIQSDVTSQAFGYRTTLGTQAAAFTLSNLFHVAVEQGTLGATSAITTQYGVFVSSSLTGATNNYGFYSNIASGTGRYNFYAAGTAANFFGGIVTVPDGTAALPSIISTTGTADTGQWFPAADTVAWSTAGTERVRFDSSGNVGIGKTPTNKPLEIYSASNPAIRIQNSTTGTGSTDGFLLEMNSSDAYLYNYEAGNLIFGTSNTERMRISSAGVVSVTGSATISTTLGVTGATTLSSTLAVTGITTVAAGSEALPSIVSTTGTADTGQWFPAADTIAYSTSGAERVRITSSGLVGINTTTPANNLHVRRGGTGFVAKIENYTNSASAHGLIIDFGDGTPSAGAIAIQFFRISSATAIGSITQSGDNVVYNTSSDRRLKENITPTSYGLSDLMKIPVTDFNFITSPAFRTPGFIAQDLYKVYPFAVTTNGDEGVDPISADATMGWQVDYGRLTPLLVSAIQELKTIIDTQTARITALETL